MASCSYSGKNRELSLGNGVSTTHISGKGTKWLSPVRFYNFGGQMRGERVAEILTASSWGCFFTGVLGGRRVSAAVELISVVGLDVLALKLLLLAFI